MCSIKNIVKYGFLRSFSTFGGGVGRKLDYSFILYGDKASPPVRFVLMTAAILDIELDFHNIDLFKQENKTDFFTKINPLQKVPALGVGNKIICDSNAIAMFLCNKFDTNKRLYPSAHLTRAGIDEMLFFNSSSLFPVDSKIFTAFFAGQWPLRVEDINYWNFLLNHLEMQLSKNTWLAGEEMLLCDIACAATVSSCRLLVPPLQSHKKINQWLQALEEYPWFNINSKGLQRLQSAVELLKSQRGFPI